MQVKDYDEAVAAIHDIVHNAKIPVIVMVAILEVTKHRLLTEHFLSKKTAEAKKFFEAMQKEAEKQDAGNGVS